jgi:DNA-binding NtrC family response regulator
MSNRILLIEDTATLQLIYSANLTSAGYEVDVASTGAEGMALFKANSNSIVIMDLFLPDVDGVDVIRKFVQDNPQAKIIVITSNGSVIRAVEAMRAGAFDFLLKPFSDERLLATVASALASFETKPEINLAGGNFYGFTGRGPVMQKLYRKILNVAPSTAPVFVVGESGVGKQVCANAIHDHSGPKSRPFVTYRGGDLSAKAQESSLFGSLEGTDLRAASDEIGALQKAYGGTLYISEVSELNPLVQSRIAAFLRKAHQNDQDIKDIGTRFPRIICSTSVDPYDLLETRKIREDLFYQLHILTVDIPPFREIGDDIIYVAERILARLSRAEKKSFVGLSSEVSSVFEQHHWPGNISQLENLLYKIVASYDASHVALEMLPIGFSSASKKAVNGGLRLSKDRFSAERSSNAINMLIGLQLDEVERQFIDATIQSQGGSIPKAAEVLGVAPSTIYRKRPKR